MKIRILIKIKKNKQKHFIPPFILSPHHLFIHTSGIRSCCVSFSRPFCSNSFPCKCSFCNLWASGTSPILNLHQISSQISYHCPELWRFYNNGSVGPLSIPSARRWGRCWECQLKVLDVCLGGCCVGQPRPLEPLLQVKGGAAFQSSGGSSGSTLPGLVSSAWPLYTWFHMVYVSHMAAAPTWFQCRHRTWASAQSSVVTGAMDISADPDCNIGQISCIV